MLVETLKSLFTRDLLKLRNEIAAYQKEDYIWRTEQNITNSAGNLCLHLIGNLNHYIGNEIGKTGYVRNRALEFSLKNVPQKELLTQIDDTIKVVGQALDLLDEKLLASEYPIMVFDQKTTYEYMLVHLTTHLSYHLGQINYHRRLVDL